VITPGARLANATVAALLLSCAVGVTGAVLRPQIEILRASRALAPHIMGRMTEPIGCAVTRTGEHIILDRRAHTVYAVDAAETVAREIVQIGFEEGRLLGPGILSVGPNDIIAVADAPNGTDRVQYFSLDGRFIGGFYLSDGAGPRMVFGSITLNGISSMHFTGREFLINRPGLGGLFSEFDLQGVVQRQIGVLRATGQEHDPLVHQALNVGLPLVDPTGGFFFVFQTGRPMFRKYSADGALVFERHIEGVELDADIQALATEWSARDPDAGTQPLVPPLINAAAVDASGRLWVSLHTPYTYVYDTHGDKIRTLQFQAAGALTPVSLSFSPDGTVIVTPGCYAFPVS